MAKLKNWSRFMRQPNISFWPRRPSEMSHAYVFRIDAFTPETILMARLAAYLAELAAMLGVEGSVHFEKITKGSAKLAMKVERPALTKVRDNVDEARMRVRGTRGDR